MITLISYQNMISYQNNISYQVKEHSKGAFTYDVSKFWTFIDPPPLPSLSAKVSNGASPPLRADVSL